MTNKKVLLAILDGWGIGDGSKSDVISSTETPNIDQLYKKYPNSKLLACGENVGLPDGQMGNSEVGHLNIGAGRIVYQDLVRINKAVANNSISDLPEIKEIINYLSKSDHSLHLLGLVSDGGVHSMNTHLYKLCEIFNNANINNVFIHALMDGRDTDPHSGIKYIEELEQNISDKTAKIASICGRYYTMDRDKRWERIKQGYDLMVHGIGEKFTNPVNAIKTSYQNNITDEFIKPVVITDSNGNPLTTIKEGDVVLCFNFRTDRLREITIALTQKDMPEYGMNTIPLKYYTMTRYDDTFKNVGVLFDKVNINNTLGEVISKNNLKQLRIAETEKYAHVTFFFSGGREETFKNEDRILIPSPKVATYDLMPEMSAYKVKDALIKKLNENIYDFICLNFANGDMVGHTGVYKAIQKAVITVDECIGEIVKTAIANNYIMMIIADHGNADYAVNTDGSPNTAHSLNPVPCILINSDYNKINDGILADVAPTILKLMNIDIPDEMTGKILIDYK
ncbi:MAG: 2,3-bisphosphoglycerate-independent phosphoglycerate mutase [Marinilabiliales bacterium]